MTTQALPAKRSPLSRLWDRELEHYPANGPRMVSLGIVVLATITLYYQFYLAGAVATKILPELHMSFVYFVNISVVGYIMGAVASFLAGIADRYGRANIVTIGLIIVALLCLLGVPNVHTKLAAGVLLVAIGFVEGVILVATPALVRDFSPQLGRASAMGFWTLGPVLGSLVVSIVVSNTSDSTPWQDQYIACGVVGLVIGLLALLGLRELAPALRDQLMVSSHDRVLIEARAKGLDIEAALKKPFRQMLKADIVMSAFAISVFLIIYYLAVGFFPIYFQTVFGFSQSKANALGNWNWTFNALSLLFFGFLSDKVRVRKPFMVIGAVGSILFTVLFAMKATEPNTSYSTFVVLLVGLSISLGCAYAPWMASFTETVERRNPALTATGLAVWGLIIRIVIAVSVFFVPHVVTTVTTLVERGPTATALVAKYQGQLASAQKIDTATQAALAKNPADQAAQVKALSELSGSKPEIVAKVVTLGTKYADELKTAQAIDLATQGALLANPSDQTALAKAVGEIETKLGLSPGEAITKLQAVGKVPQADLIFMATSAPPVQKAVLELTAVGKIPAGDVALLKKVQKAATDSPKQWQNYFWIAVGGEVLFIPLIFVMAGFWDPRKAKLEEEAHERLVDAELAKLASAEAAPAT